MSLNIIGLTMGSGIHPIFAVLTYTYIGLAISQLSCTVLSYYGTEIALRNRPDAGRTDGRSFKEGGKGDKAGDGRNVESCAEVQLDDTREGGREGGRG